MRVLQQLMILNDRLHKGAIILNQVDPLLYLFPWINQFFYVIERHGWFGVNEASRADIMMVEDPSALPTLKEEKTARHTAVIFLRGFC